MGRSKIILPKRSRVKTGSGRSKKYRRSVQRQSLNTAREFADRSVENNFLVGFRKFDVVKAPFCNVEDPTHWVFQQNGGNPFLSLKDKYRGVVTGEDAVNSLAFSSNDGDANYTLNQGFCLTKSEGWSEFIRTGGKGEFVDMCVDGYPVDLKGIADVAFSSTWALGSVKTCQAFLDNKRLDLALGVSSLLQLRWMQMGLPTFVCMVNSDHAMLVNLTALYWKALPKETFRGSQADMSDLVKSFLDEHNLTHLVDGCGQRQGFQFTTNKRSHKGGTTKHSLHIENGDTRSYPRLRVEMGQVLPSMNSIMEFRKAKACSWVMSHDDMRTLLTTKGALEKFSAISYIKKQMRKHKQ